MNYIATLDRDYLLFASIVRYGDWLLIRVSPTCDLERRMPSLSFEPPSQ
ncbi:hypothetical protein [Microcoleus sp. FACHB-672]|nr:hypothetical protein [Microcoleus sp. FACHB-672]MBD2041591.1 hypothetical protein [Microcoleus sp. FACHB-672]